MKCQREVGVIMTWCRVPKSFEAYKTVSIYGLCSVETGPTALQDPRRSQLHLHHPILESYRKIKPPHGPCSSGEARVSSEY